MNQHNGPDSEDKPLSTPTIIALVGLAAVITFALLYFFLRPGQDNVEPEPLVVEPLVTEPAVTEKEAEAPQAVEPEPTTPPEEEPAAEIEPEPIAAEPQPEPLPNLYNSDSSVMEDLEEIDGNSGLLKLVMPESIVQRFVRVVVALHEGKLVSDYRPVTSPKPELQVIAIDEPLNPDVGQRYYLSTKNYNRYEPWISAFEKVDKKIVAKLYRYYYPLLQESYEQHGAKIEEFETVLMQVIDRSLAVESIAERPILVQQKVYYQYYDKNLESQNDLVKLLTRMGPNNTTRLQTALRELRDEIKALQ